MKARFLRQHLAEMKRLNPQKIKEFLLLHSLGIAITMGTFIFDLIMPLGVAAGIPYALLVLLSLRSPSHGLTWFAALSATTLTLVGFALSPPGGEMWKVLTNRLLAVFVIWVTAYLCLDHKRNAAKIEEDRIALIQSDRMASLGEIGAGIAHELGTPLATIQGRVELLEMQLDSPQIDSGKVRHATKIIHEVTEQMVRIIRGMRTLARDAASDPLQPTSLARVIRNVLALFSEHPRKLRIELRIGTLDDAIKVPCREAQISQVLMNLVNNATDAIQDLQERWIQIELWEGGDSVQVSVTDSGHGIPEDIRANIMDPFFTTKEVGKGTGLGLSISQGIVESHSGSLWIDDDCANTRFVISLPKLRQEPASDDRQATSGRDPG